MANLTVQANTPAGLNPTFSAAAAGGDTFSNDGKTYLRVKNGHSAAQTVTITAAYQCSHGFSHNGGASVPAGAEREFGPFAVSRFGDPVALTYSGVTLLTVAVITS